MELDIFERDLRPFADPATNVEVVDSQVAFRAKLTRDGADLTVMVERETGKVTAQISPHGDLRHFVSFRSLLASDLFASVKAMAENQRRILASTIAQKFIEPEGQIGEVPMGKHDFEKASCLKSATGTTQPISLMLIDGPAGVGKTSLITRLVATRAVNYGRDADEPVVLHVANRGRRLASLDDLIALSIQLIRARFTYDQVPALIRNGVIQIAIDGFDELVDSDGYGDAWSVLKEFLQEVECGGPILLAGRDTFFELSGFQTKLGQIGSKTAISHVRLAAITARSAREWLISCGWPEADLKTNDAQDLLKDGSYALRPYFLNQIAELGGINQLLQELISPREFLIRKFIERESDLITARVPLSNAKATELLKELFEFISIEMAEAETEAVDVPFLQLAVELVFEKALQDPSDLAKLRHKAGSFALMDKDARGDFRRFPHTEISNHFLASALLNGLLKGETSRFLRRGYFGSDLMSVVGDAFFLMRNEHVEKIRKYLIGLIRSEIGFERLSENACSLVLQSLVRDTIDEPLKLARISAGEVAMFGTAGKAELSMVNISRLDARGVDLTRVSFRQSRVATMLVDEITSFGEQTPIVDLLMIETDGAQRNIYDPERISEWIARHGHVNRSLEGTNAEAVALLAKVARVFTRQFFIKDDETEADGRYLSNPLWQSIEEILLEAGRFRRNDRLGTAGRNSDFVHIINAHALLASATEQDRQIWAKVAELR